MNTGGMIPRERNEVIALMKMAFPEFPIRVYDSQSDRESLWIKVFYVPEKYHKIVEDFILDIQEGFERCLLPNVYSNSGWCNGKQGYRGTEGKRKSRKKYAP